jgi:hypothetical protein
MRKLKASEVALYRETLLQKQMGRCALCGELIEGDDVLDHDHKTGIVRGVVHRGCNAMLGHIENNRARNHLTDPVKLARMLRAVPAYITGLLPSTDSVLYPTHKTEDEKRELRNKRARLARKKAKA